MCVFWTLTLSFFALIAFHSHLYSLDCFFCLCHPQIWFAFVNGFSGQILFERWCIGLYNVVSVSKINSLKSSLSLLLFDAWLSCGGAPELIPLSPTIIDILKTFSFIYDPFSTLYSLCVPNYVLNSKEQQRCMPRSVYLQREQLRF